MQPPSSHLRTAVAALLLAALLPQLTADAQHALDVATVRPVIEAVMRCQGVRQFHAAAVHRDRELLSIGLELLPNGQVVNISGKLMYLASVSKGVFGTALVRVEEHLKSKNSSFSLFNTPIKQLIGDNEFWFLDHIRTELVTIDDLISHRTGLARHDGMWYLRNWQSKEELVKYVSRLEATAEFRNSFVYNNLVWTIADLLVQKLTSRTFVQYMREFLWTPLGMTDTRGSSEMSSALLSRADFSTNFRPLGLPLPVSKMEQSTRVVEAAGGIVTSLPDMVKYMKLHASNNYSATQPVPGQFLPLNAQASVSGFNLYFDKRIYNDGITNLPDWEIESYTRGWLRTWYRDHLDYSHGGSLLGVRSELDVFPKQNLAVFNHMTLGSASDAPYQSMYAVVINKYLSDLLIANQSHVTKENVCSLIKNTGNPGVARLTRRKLENGEIDALKGSYGNYGFGKVQLSYNQSSHTMTMTYGFGVLELIPVVVVAGQNEPYHFYLNLLEPVELGSTNSVINRTDEAITVPAPASQSPASFITVRTGGAGGKLEMEGAALEAGMKLTKDLDPSSWKRPSQCKSAGRIGESGVTGWWQRLGMAGAAVALIVGAGGM